MTDRDEGFGLVGIGFGPSGISLASAIEDAVERDGESGLGRVLFLERRPDSAWQSELLLRETDIQHHFLRDLATPRNPRSRFTFANYLKEKGRLFDFGELVFGASGGAVGRIEWSDYQQWAAEQLSDYVRYDQEVTEVEPIAVNGGIKQLRVSTETDSLVARRLVCCGGRVPFVPEIFRTRLGPRLFHSTDYLSSIERLNPALPLRFSIIGSGQSAAEIMVHLHQAFPSCTMTSIHRSIGFQLVDLSQFSNEVFHPGFTDLFHALPTDKKAWALTEVFRTNYGTIDQQIADTLYRKIYEDRVQGRSRIDTITRCNLAEITEGDDSYTLALTHRYTAEHSVVEADVIVLCTGQQETALPALLAPLGDLIETDTDGGPRIGRDYRVATTPELEVPIYFSGLCERTHGIADATSFSGMALRAERIYDSLRAG